MLGEGVGGAYINASAIRNGVHNRGGEFGHMVIHPGGKQCLCGKKGCFEAYVSENFYHQSLIHHLKISLHRQRRESLTMWIC